MHSSDSEHLSDDSGDGDDPDQSSAVPNSLFQLQDDYATGSDSVVPATPEKQFDEEEGQSDCSDLHTPAQPSKRRRIPSVSPGKRRQVAVPDSDSDGVDRDSLFDSPSDCKRGFNACGCRGRLSSNGRLTNTIGRLPTKKSRQL